MINEVLGLTLRLYRVRYAKLSTAQKFILIAVEFFIKFASCLGFTGRFVITLRYKSLVRKWKLREASDLVGKNYQVFAGQMGFWPAVLENPSVLTIEKKGISALLVGPESPVRETNEMDKYLGYLAPSIERHFLIDCSGVYANNYKAVNMMRDLRESDILFFWKDQIPNFAPKNSKFMVRGGMCDLFDELSIVRYCLDLLFRGYDQVTLSGFPMYLKGTTSHESVESTRESLIAHDVVMNAIIIFGLVDKNVLLIPNFDSMSLEDYLERLEDVYGV